MHDLTDAAALKSVTMHGYTVKIEHPAGTERTGVGKDGKAWSRTMTADYGYLAGTKGKAADGDAVDAFIGPVSDADAIYVVNQNDPETGAFDEHKVMFGYGSDGGARESYDSHYPADWEGCGSVAILSPAAFADWLSADRLNDPAQSAGFDMEKLAIDKFETDAAENALTTTAGDAPAAPADETPLLDMQDAILIGETQYEVVDAAGSDGALRMLATLANVPNENLRYFTPAFLRGVVDQANAYAAATPRYGEEPHPPFDPKRRQFDTNSANEVWLHKPAWFCNDAGDLYATVIPDPSTPKGARVKTKTSRKEKVGASVRWHNSKMPPMRQLTDGRTVQYFDTPMIPYCFPAVLDHVPNPAFTQAGRVLDAGGELLPMLDATDPALAEPIAVAATVDETETVSQSPATETQTENISPTDSLTPKEPEMPEETQPVVTPPPPAAVPLPPPAGNTQAPPPAPVAVLDADTLKTLDEFKKFQAQQAEAAETAKNQADVTALADAISGGGSVEGFDLSRFTAQPQREAIASIVKSHSSKTAALNALPVFLATLDAMNVAASSQKDGLAPAVPAVVPTGQTTQPARTEVIVDAGDKKVQEIKDKLYPLIDQAMHAQGREIDPALRKANEPFVKEIMDSLYGEGPGKDGKPRIGMQALVDNAEFLLADASEKHKFAAQERHAVQSMVDAGMFDGSVPLTDAAIMTGDLRQQPLIMQIILERYYQDLESMQWMGGISPSGGISAEFAAAPAGNNANLGRVFRFQTRVFTPPAHSRQGRDRSSLYVAEGVGIPESGLQNNWQNFNTSSRKVAFSVTNETRVAVQTGTVPYDPVAVAIAENLAFFGRDTDQLGYLEMASITDEIGAKVLAAEETVAVANLKDGTVQDGIRYGDGTKGAAAVVCIAQPNCEGANSGAVRITDNNANASSSNAYRTPVVMPRPIVTVDDNGVETVTMRNPVQARLGNGAPLVLGWLTADYEIAGGDYAVDWGRGKFVFAASANVNAATANLKLTYSYSTNFDLFQINFNAGTFTGANPIEKYLNGIFYKIDDMVSRQESYPNFLKPDTALMTTKGSTNLTHADIFDQFRSPIPATLTPTNNVFITRNNLTYAKSNAPSILGDDRLLLFRNRSSKFAIDRPLMQDGPHAGYEVGTGLLTGRSMYAMDQYDIFCTPMARERTTNRVYNSPYRSIIFY